MYEDASIELHAFRPGSRVFCIASAGCTAMRLAPAHEVVAVDVNPAQLAYAERRAAGAPAIHGAADALLRLGRALAPLVGWRRSTVLAFLDLDDPDEQIAYWRAHLDTRRFRAALDALLSVTALRAVYASPLLEALPRRFAAVLRTRMERCFAMHPNRTNPYARLLLLGESMDDPLPPPASCIRFVHADAAEYLERGPTKAFDGFTLSNIVDGAPSGYRQRLAVAVKRASAPGAVVVLRSFADPAEESATNHAADDRSILWGTVDVRPAETLD